jgi:ankyrin repeat protein
VRVSSAITLTSAVTSGDESAVSALIASGADVNESTGGGQTPLILAVIFGHTHIVEQLVQAGADAHQRDNLGLNAIDWAKRRGITQALDILTNTRRVSTPPKKIVINLGEPEKREAAKPVAPDPDTSETVSEAEKSRRWIAGFKQRLDEQASRRLNREPEPPPISQQVKAPQPEPEPEVQETKPLPVPEPATPFHSTRILTPDPPSTTGKRKRCPQCGAVYNGDIVSYCAVDMTALVDADAPIISEPEKSSPPLLWILVTGTLAGALIAGLAITSYVYRSNRDTAGAPATQPATIIKGVPELGPELAGKAVVLPEAECPLKGPEPVSGVVTVYVLVDKNGQVYKARGSGGDWLMRGAANEAAMKSTFSRDKLRGRETEGTIVYTFKP